MGLPPTMFGFLTPQTKDDTDPLVSARAVSAWLRHLPTQDVIARQHHVMRIFDGMRQSSRPMDLHRVAAIQFLDTALGADRRQLVKQYVENIDRSARVADRGWQAAQEMSQGFVYAYQTALEQALADTSNPRWKPMVPQVFARLLHYHGTDAKLRAFRHERWIPAKWTNLHQLYARATELGIVKTAVALPSAGPGAMQWSTEQEYVYALLIQQLNMGSLSPAEIDWASAQMRAWGRKLEFETVPRSSEGFYVDLASKRGLVRRTGNESGPTLHFLDTTPLADQLERAMHSLRQADIGEPGAAAAVNQQRIGILEKVRPVVAPNLHGDLRRTPRMPVTVAAKVRVGLARICVELTPKEVVGSANDADAGNEQIEVFAVADRPRARHHVPDEHDSLAASIVPIGDQAWQVKDRSVAGLRISASGGIGQSLVLGALVAIRQSDAVEWVLGAVRRLNKVSNDEVEAGVSIIADRVVPITVHARRPAKEDLGMVVNGVDVSMMGSRFDALYLPPPSRPEKPLAVKTLIVPTSEYADGRNLILTTGHSVYTIALRHLVEQRADWSWAAFQIVDKKPTDY
jgi:cyclic-di-GMP-binding protein